MSIPNDPDDMNEDRASWARAALGAFMGETYQTDQIEALGDLVCDLRHLADRLGMDWYKVLDGAGLHYTYETLETDNK